MIAQRRWRELLRRTVWRERTSRLRIPASVLVSYTYSDIQELGMSPCSDNRAWRVVDDLRNGDRGECECPSHLTRLPLDLNQIPILRRAQIGDMDIGAHTRLHSVIPRRDGHTAHPVYDGGRHGAVDASVCVDVVLGQSQTGAH